MIQSSATQSRGRRIDLCGIARGKLCRSIAPENPDCWISKRKKIADTQIRSYRRGAARRVATRREFWLTSDPSGRGVSSRFSQVSLLFEYARTGRHRLMQMPCLVSDRIGSTNKPSASKRSTKQTRSCLPGEMKVCERLCKNERLCVRSSVRPGGWATERTNGKKRNKSILNCCQPGVVQNSSGRSTFILSRSCGDPHVS